MRWVISTLLGIGMFAVSIIVALLLVNSFLTIAVAQSNHALDKTTEAMTGQGIGIEQLGSGFVISTSDSSMTVTQNGIEMPTFGI